MPSLPPHGGDRAVGDTGGLNDMATVPVCLSPCPPPAVMLGAVTPWGPISLHKAAQPWCTYITIPRCHHCKAEVFFTQAFS